MKVLVIGANGMAGHVITRYLKQQGHTVTTLARSNADIVMDVENFTETQQLLELLEVLDTFDFAINCVGLLVKDSIDRPDRAALINGWFPHFLEHIFSKSNTRVIHLSTDCVFDGKKGNYVETDIHTETNSYGKSKSLGELNNIKDITFRMSIIGPEIKSTGTGLFQWIATNPQQELQGWDNAWWNGITTLELAKCIEKYMLNPIITGVYHVVNNENKISKYDLVSKINEVYQLGKTILRTQGPKPVNKILIDTRKEFDFNINNYDTQLIELKNFMNE
jgi:dTDP-4-dehydrorhamnose reductase